MRPADKPEVEGDPATPIAPGAAANPAVVGRTTYFTPSVDSRMVFTNNAGADPQTGEIRKDIVIEVQPTLAFERRGPRLRLSGEFSVSALDYVNGSQVARLLPRGRADMSAKVIEDLLYLDAWVRVDPTFDDPYAAHPDAATSYRLESQTRYNLSPSVKKRLGDFGVFEAREEYNNGRTTDIVTNATTHVTSTDRVVSFTHEPRPLGIAVEVKSHDETNELQPETVLDTREGRLWVDVALDPQFIVGAVVGREKTSLLISNPYESVHGWRVRYRPTDRTDMNLTVENRYFGRGIGGTFSHRSPRVSINLQVNRLVSSQGIPELVFASGDNIQNAINSQLTTRFPDPIERQNELNKLLPLLQGLGDTANSPTTIYSKVAQLRQSASLQLGYQGVRNFVYAQFGYLSQRAVQLQDTRADDSYDALQRLAGIGINSRLTPSATMNLSSDWSRIQDLGLGRTDKYTQQRVLRAEVVQTLTPRSFGTLGLRQLSVKKFPPDATDTAGETALYIGLRHRF
ncbi:MAG: TIGR03016 family PEP-CTERM system-associated outer membrane protein [Rhizobacter sp.]